MFNKNKTKKKTTKNPNKKVRLKQGELDTLKRDSFLLGAMAGMGAAGIINFSSDFMKKRKERLDHKNAGSINSLIGKTVCK